MASENAINEVSLVEAAVGPLVAPTAIFLALVVLALELDASLVPRLSPVSMLLVIQPFTVVCGAFGVDECTPAIGHAIHPLPLVDAPICLYHAAQTFHLIVHELALVL